MAVQPELKSSFLKNILEEEEYQSNVKALQDWLTGATQAATQQYQATAQTAAEQASYDISGAYANYLKQQRAVTAQGQLESGHKEEIGGALQQQYQGAYSQARATQAQDVAKAQETYTKSVSEYGETASKAAQSYYNAALKEAGLRAELFKAAEGFAKFSEDSLYDLYSMDDKGNYTLTDYGYELLSSKLLGEGDAFKKYLEDEKMNDVLEYYLTDPTGLHEKMFGITETKYDPKSEESYARRLGAVSKEGVSYIDTLDKPKPDFNWNDFRNTIDFDEGGHNKLINVGPDVYEYATTELGLSDAEIREALGVGTNEPIDQAIKMSLAKLSHDISSKKSNPEQAYNMWLRQLDDRAKEKYGVTDSVDTVGTGRKHL